MQESRIPDREPPDSRSRLSEPDLVLVDALQYAPRAPWTRIGRAIGADPTTAARRWERLRAAGLAWVTAYDAPDAATIAYVEVRCRPGSLDAVTAALAGMAWVFSLDVTAGDYDLLVSVAAADLPRLGQSVHRLIGGLPGVRSTRTRLALTFFGEGGDWRMGAMEPALRTGLAASRSPRRPRGGTRTPAEQDPEDRALKTALGADGRMGYTELGAAAGMSEHTARRRLQRMIRTGSISFRCDLARPLAGLSTMVVFRGVVPHGRLEATGSAVARMEQVRMCASVSGPHNLLIAVWLPGLSGIASFEASLAERFPELEVKDRSVALQSAKRMGWLLDIDGRAVRRVPLGLPEHD
ncbi:Lrp/AsnC family transcriptional regulator [Streptomyces sp. NPDC059398]|uniref:Lrp/AsnC family transcriptional regulator n=1 Tax=Streptomyces sp. NPDC059398 TaxID=3346820 RepID=UPI0036A13F2D